MTGLHLLNYDRRRFRAQISYDIDALSRATFPSEKCSGCRFYVEQGRGRGKEGGKEDVHSSSMRIHKVARHIAINVGGTSREFGI